jgi:hypothetical protein
MQPLEPSIQPRARVVLILAVIGFIVWNLGFEHD